MRWSHFAAWITVGAAIVSPLSAGVGAAQSSGERHAMREAFERRVDGYARLHRDVERLLPPEAVTSDLEALFAQRNALAAEMRKARAGARQGDIFTPGIAVFFRVVIAETLRHEGITDLVESIDEENEVHIPPAVNGDYPAGQSIPMMPTCLLAALPRLPIELRYSFVGRDLILWDAHAGLIVDFVPNAVPVFTSPSTRH